MSNTTIELTGTIKFFDTVKGFGFLIRDDGKPDLFCHISQVAPEFDYPNQGDRVTFIDGKTRDGRPCAKRVVVV